MATENSTPVNEESAEQPKKRPKKQRRVFNRRNFLVGGAILLGGSVATVYFGRNAIRRNVHHTLATSDAAIVSIENMDEPMAMFEMQPDNKLMLNAPYAEMGQGIITGFAMLAAEELDLRMDQILVRPTPFDAVIDNGATGGSGTTRAMYQPMREIAATFREMLKMAAGKQWGVDPSSIQTADGVLSANGNEMTYIDLINSTSEWEMPEETPELRPRSSFKVVGTDQRRSDLKPKVMGEPIFALDYELPDMLHANLLKCPFIGGSIKSIDIDAAKAFPGVIDVVQQEVGGDEMIAVVAENRWAAEMGKRALNAEWDVPKEWEQSEIDTLTTVGADGVSPVSLQLDGRASRVLDEDGGTLVSAEYRVATGVHAHMEPNSAIADVKGDRAFIITGSQGPSFHKGAVANAIGIDADNVDVQNAYLGGAFGRRVALNPAPEAAVLSQKFGQPVQVVWDRETEFLCGLFRPPTHHAFRAKIDDSGKVTAIEHGLASGSQIIDILAEMLPMGEFLHGFLGADLMSASHGATFMYDFENRETNMWHIDLPFT
ncbi:MAG: molybdopterin cofactor-binding domain-containing protein, partial [Chloroflexota bacterium]